MNHKKYMARCIELAQKAAGKTYPNPMVGCVIVHNDQIIGEGFHEKAGEAHAEINAINKVKKPSLLKESTIYVSLEPCAHFGRTPPCANRIVEAGFQHVVIGARDAHEKVDGKGIKILTNAGIQVTTGILEKECLELNKRFFTYHQQRRPYIILKWAETADGFMDRNFKPEKISNSLVNQYVHRLRAYEHAIMVGTKTALTDNPSLTTRAVCGRNPVRIVIDLELKVPTDFNIYNEEADTIVFSTVKSSAEGHLKFIKLDPTHMLTSLMEHLYELQIQSVLVEGGAYTLNKLIEANLWDEAIIIHNRELKTENGTASPSLSIAHHQEKILRNNTVRYFRNTEK